MRRRVLLAATAVAALSSEPVRAQEKAMPVIGVLSTGSPGPSSEPFMGAFRQGLSEAGYVAGQNLAIEYRWAEGHYDRLPALAAELVGRKIDLIMAGSPRSALAAKSATSTIPIVFRSGSDPVGEGLVASLARPGGNLTEISNLNDRLTVKRLELLSELVPRAGPIEGRPQNSRCRARSRALCRLGLRREGDGRPVAQGFAEHARGLRHGSAQEGVHTVQGRLSPLHHRRRLAADPEGLRILAGADEGDRDGSNARGASLVRG